MLYLWPHLMTLSLTHSTPTTSGSLLFRKHTNQGSSSGSLHLLCLLPGKFLPHISPWFLPLLPSNLWNGTLLVRPSLITWCKGANFLPPTVSLFPLLSSVFLRTTKYILYTYFFTCLSSLPLPECKLLEAQRQQLGLFGLLSFLLFQDSML